MKFGKTLESVFEVSEHFTPDRPGPRGGFAALVAFNSNGSSLCRQRYRRERRTARSELGAGFNYALRRSLAHLWRIIGASDWSWLGSDANFGSYCHWPRAVSNDMPLTVHRDDLAEKVVACSH